jgi:hypothetical protein
MQLTFLLGHSPHPLCTPMLCLPLESVLMRRGNGSTPCLPQPYENAIPVELEVKNHGRQQGELKHGV